MAAWRSTTESEDAALQAPLGELGEEALDGVEPGAGGRREVEGPARMAGEPSPDLRVLVGGVVVEDGVDQLAGRDRGLDGVEEADELLVPVALHVAADDGAVEHVEGGEQRGGAVALVVVGHGAGAALLHGQAGLGAVERLDLMGWMAPYRHPRAKVVAVEVTRQEPSAMQITTIGLDLAKHVFQVHGVDANGVVV